MTICAGAMQKMVTICQEDEPGEVVCPIFDSGEVIGKERRSKEAAPYLEAGLVWCSLVRPEEWVCWGQEPCQASQERCMSLEVLISERKTMPR